MTKEEKQKAIDALKISAPIMAVTQEKFNDYLKKLNMIIDWLEEEGGEMIRNTIIDWLEEDGREMTEEEEKAIDALIAAKQKEFYDYAQMVNTTMNPLKQEICEGGENE